MKNILCKQIDNTGLVLFRMVFGALIALEGFGAIATGWVKRTLVDPEFTFNFIGFEFLQPLPGNGMYFYFATMGVLGVFIMLGYKYRWSMVGFALLWTCVYLMQKSAYNNHYYLLMLLCWIMALMPAHRAYSIDAKNNPSIKSYAMPQGLLWLLIAQIWIVFTYASVAKWYPDWINATAPSMFMKGKAHYWLIGPWLQHSWVHYCIAYVGIIFDLIIIPLLLFKKTRRLGFFLSLFFHLFNSIVFQVGIFPYMSIAFAFFFFSSESLIKTFKLKRPLYTKSEIKVPNYYSIFTGVAICYLIIQVALPLRHWVIPEDVLWTEEGHRLSWRMMLRTKSGNTSFWIEDKETRRRTRYNLVKNLSKKQRRSVQTKPDMMWQLAQRIKKEAALENRDVAVYVTSRISINGGPYLRFIDPTVDIASQKWSPFKHTEWILPAPADYHQEISKK